MNLNYNILKDAANFDPVTIFACLGVIDIQSSAN